MKLTIKIDMDNAAFTYHLTSYETETIRILQNFIDYIYSGYSLSKGESGKLLDINGNVCGFWKVSKR